MKALILKDLYVMWKQARVFLVIILVFSILPSSYTTFAVIYAAMLPYTAMAYDERSKWDQLAAMLPYRDRDVVLSKYVLGWLACAATAGLSLLIQAVLPLVWRSAPDMVPLPILLLALCASVCVLAISLPLMVRFGVERGRMTMFLVIFLVCGSAGALSGLVETDFGFRLTGGLIAALVVGAVVLTAASVPLSVRLYRKRSA